MELLGVGPTEFIFIVIIALIVIGPKDLAKTGRTVGQWLNNIVQSDTWKAVKQTSRELSQLPTKLMREDNLEKFLTEGEQRPSAGTNAGTWSGKIGKGTASPRTNPAPESKNENMIHPPITVDGPPAEILEPAKKKSNVTTRKKPSPAKKSVKKPAVKSPGRAPRKQSNA